MGRWIQYNGRLFAVCCFEDGRGKILRPSDKKAKIYKISF